MESTGTSAFLSRLQSLKVALTSQYGLSVPSWTTMATWTIGIALLIGITLMDAVPLWNEYKYNNVATRIEVIMMDRNFTPPPLVMVFPAYTSENMESEELMQIARYLANETRYCEACKGLESAGWDVWNDGTLALYNDSHAAHKALSLELIQKLISTDTETIFDENSRWNELIFHALVSFFIRQGRIDYYGRPDLSDPGLSAFHATLFSSDPARTQRLHSTMLAKICQTLTFREYDLDAKCREPTPKTCLDLLLNRSEPVFVDDLGLWFPLPELERPEMRKYVFTMHSSEFWIPNFEAAAKAFKIFPDTSIVYIAASDPIVSSHLYQLPKKLPKMGHSVNIRYSVQMRAKESRPGAKCQKEHSVTCATKCTKYWLIEKCGCVPFTTRSGLEYDPTLPFCNATTYGSCNVSMMSKEAQDECISRCKTACEYTSYNWHIGYENYKTENNATELTLQMMPIYNAFTELSWTLKNTDEQFVSQIGGIVNLYLGFSGVSIFAFVTMCIDFWKRWKKRRSVKDSRNSIHEDLAGWKVAKKVSFAEPEKDEAHLNKLREDYRSEMETLKAHMDALEKRWNDAFYRPNSHAALKEHLSRGY